MAKTAIAKRTMKPQPRAAVEPIVAPTQPTTPAAPTAPTVAAIAPVSSVAPAPTVAPVPTPPAAEVALNSEDVFRDWNPHDLPALERRRAELSAELKRQQTLLAELKVRLMKGANSIERAMPTIQEMQIDLLQGAISGLDRLIESERNNRRIASAEKEQAAKYDELAELAKLATAKKNDHEAMFEYAAKALLFAENHLSRIKDEQIELRRQFLEKAAPLVPNLHRQNFGPGESATAAQLENALEVLQSQLAARGTSYDDALTNFEHPRRLFPPTFVDLPYQPPATSTGLSRESEKELRDLLTNLRVKRQRGRR